MYGRNLNLNRNQEGLPGQDLSGGANCWRVLLTQQGMWMMLRMGVQVSP